MKKNRQKLVFDRPVGFIVIVALIAGTIGFVGMNKLASSKKSSRVVACDAKECVNLRDGLAVPDTINVPVGSFVQFNSADGKKYNLAIKNEKGSLAYDHGGGADNHEEGDIHAEESHHDADSSAFKSGDFKDDEAWRVQFKEKGTYIFTDAYNPKISILVVVYQPGGTYKIN